VAVHNKREWKKVEEKIIINDGYGRRKVILAGKKK